MSAAWNEHQVAEVLSEVRRLRRAVEVGETDRINRAIEYVDHARASVQGGEYGARLSAALEALDAARTELARLHAEAVGAAKIPE